MKRLYQLFFLFLSLLLVSGCTDKINTQENLSLNFIGFDSLHFLYSKLESVYLDKNLLYSGITYEESWLNTNNSPLKLLDKNWNYLIVQEQEKKIWSKKLYYSWGFYEANFPRLDSSPYQNFYQYGSNIAYYKCEKLIFFSDSNTNDCLANQILVNDKVIDQIDMDFFDKNRKYLFAIRYLDDTKMIYVKWDKYYRYDILKNEKEEYKELNQLRDAAIKKALNLNYISEDDILTNEYFDFIGFYNNKIVTVERNFGSMYDDILISKIGENMKKAEENMNDYSLYSADFPYISSLEDLHSELQFPSFIRNSDGEDVEDLKIYPYIFIYSLSKIADQNVGDLKDIYIDGDLYESNTLSPVIKDNNIFYLKYRNILFEESNNQFFKLPQKTMIQYMYPTSKSYMEYKIYKGKELLSKFDYRSDNETFSESAFTILNSKEDNCGITINSDYKFANDVTICTDGVNTLIQSATPDSIETGLQNELLLYNWLKIDLDTYKYKTIEETKRPNLINNFGFKSQFIFWEEGLNGIIYVSPKMNDEKIEDLKMMEALRGNESANEDDADRKMLKYISSKIWIPYSEYEALSWKDEKDYTPRDILVVEKFDNYFNKLEQNNNINYLEFSADTMNFKNPKVIIENVDELLGVY